MKDKQRYKNPNHKHHVADFVKKYPSATEYNHHCANVLILGITELCSYDQDHQTDESLQKCIHERNDFAQQEIRIDGVPIENVGQFRFTTDFINVTWPEDNIFAFPPSTNRALLDGTWLMLKPLTPGNHTVEVKVAQIIPGRESENLFLDLNYNLNAVKWDL